jgi:hypothetical protein
MTANIEKGKSKTIQKHTKGDKRFITKMVQMPDELKGHLVDIFLIRKNHKTQKARIDLVSRKVKDTAEIRITGTKDENLHFVIIEPKYVNCVYNRVR